MKIGKYKTEKLSSANARDFIMLYKKFISSTVCIKNKQKKNAERFLRNAQRNKNYRIFIVYDKKRPISFFCFVLNHRRPKVAYLHGIFVEKKYKKKGIATAIRKKEILMLRSYGMKRVILRTWSSNSALIALNEKTGFTAYRRIRRNRVDGSDTLWFKKKI